MSPLERTFLVHLRAAGLPEPETEHRFHPKRRWRFDFAFPESRIAVEVEGGTWAGGRHTTGKGFQKDCEKYNAAVELGWRVLRFDSAMVRDGRALQQTEKLLRGDAWNSETRSGT